MTKNHKTCRMINLKDTGLRHPTQVEKSLFPCSQEIWLATVRAAKAARISHRTWLNRALTDALKKPTPKPSSGQITPDQPA
jgi:hypothetical protein